MKDDDDSDGDGVPDARENEFTEALYKSIAAAPAALADAAPVSPSIITTGIDHHTWLDQIGPNVNVPQVDTSVHQSR